MIKHHLDWFVAGDELRAVHEEINIAIYVGFGALRSGIMLVPKHECCLIHMTVNGPSGHNWHRDPPTWPEGCWLEVKDTEWGLDNAFRRAWEMTNNYLLRCALRDLRPDYDAGFGV